MYSLAKRLTLLVFSAFFLGPHLSEAQLPRLNILLPSDAFPITLDETVIETSVVNNSSMPSQPFRLRLWVSIDSTFNDDDMPVTLDQPLGLGGCPSSNICPRTPVLQRSFKFPLPDQVTDPSDRLFGDMRSPSEWIGNKIFLQACISVAGGPFTDCRNEEQVVIAPGAILQSASRGTSASSIDVKWLVPPDDNGLSLVSHYRLEETRWDSIGGRRVTVIPVDDLTLVNEPNGQQSFLYKVRGMERGVYHSYALKACNQVGADIRCENGGSGVAAAYAIAQFSASSGILTGAVQVTWREFSIFTEGYDLRRCIVGVPSDCEILAYNIQSTSYLDLTVERGIEYVYDVFSCNSYFAGLNECQIFNSPQISDYHKTGVSNRGFSNLIDQYEDDDNPAQAKQVRGTVSQLRSFDTNDDEDWVEIILSKPQAMTIVTSGDTNNDTELTLYEADATTEISGDPSGQVGLYARLKTDVLVAGRYYLKVFQKDPGISALYKPVVNYRLDIEIAKRQVIFAPIIDLLLGD